MNPVASILAQRCLESVRQRSGGPAFFDLPTLAWFDESMRLFPRMGIQNHFRCLAIPALLGFLTYSTPSFATITLVSAAGASNIDLTTSTKPVIYAGFAGTCTATDNTQTCDSCTGEDVSGSKLWPCNKKNAYTNLRLTIQIQSSNSSVTASDAIVKMSDTTYTPGITPTMADGVLTLQLTWNEICANMSGGTSGCTTDFNGDLAVGFRTTSDSTTTDDVLTFKVSGRVAKADFSDWVYTDCPTDETTVPSGSGFCHFSTYRGDEKIYANDLRVAPDYPATTASSINYSNLVFFYREQPSGEDDNTTISQITNASDYFAVSVNKSMDPPVADNRIDGLTNDVRYCMVMANQDQTGIISFYTPLPGTTGGVTAAELCATPSKVVGLLDDKSCFIATAAFGSDMAPEVQIFREFRNSYLLTSKIGTKLVRLYYKHSPFWANLIADNETLKVVVRAALWPLLYFARMSVSLGLWAALLFYAFAGVSLLAVYRRLFSRSRVRGAL